MSIFDLPACLSANVSAKKAVRHPTFPRTAGLCSQKRNFQEGKHFSRPDDCVLKKTFRAPFLWIQLFGTYFSLRKKGCEDLGKSTKTQLRELKRFLHALSGHQTMYCAENPSWWHLPEPFQSQLEVKTKTRAVRNDTTIVKFYMTWFAAMIRPNHRPAIPH